MSQEIERTKITMKEKIWRKNYIIKGNFTTKRSLKFNFWGVKMTKWYQTSLNLKHQTIENVATPTANKKFYTKFVARFTNQLLISDSTYKLVRQNDIGKEPAIHSYPSSTTQGLGNIVNNYAPSNKEIDLCFTLKRIQMISKTIRGGSIKMRREIKTIQTSNLQIAESKEWYIWEGNLQSSQGNV